MPKLKERFKSHIDIKKSLDLPQFHSSKDLIKECLMRRKYFASNKTVLSDHVISHVGKALKWYQKSVV